ncbi:hypothetical protein Tco_0725540 [Tanacetum coccineum]|uniref:Uncharacterized protein n=1 Tax=Tanacetum coccineum TaxID=301880 RepID=A0ABQ4YD69_9ASTR
MMLPIPLEEEKNKVVPDLISSLDQKISDIYICETTILFAFKLIAFQDKSTEGQSFEIFLDEMIVMRPGKHLPASKKAKLKLMGLRKFICIQDVSLESKRKTHHLLRRNIVNEVPKPKKGGAKLIVPTIDLSSCSKDDLLKYVKGNMVQYSYIESLFYRVPGKPENFASDCSFKTLSEDTLVFELFS